MIDRLLRWPILFIAAGLFLTIMVWPVVALAVKCFSAPLPSFAFSARHFDLLIRTLGLSLFATILCIMVALPAAFVVGRAGDRPKKFALLAPLLASLLCPAMVYVFGWQRVLPSWVPAQLRCVLIWSLWAWPIPALFMGAAWARQAHASYEAALLIASRANSFFRIALPQLFHSLVLSALILFVLFFTDYGVPHANGLQVYATEMLSWASSSNNPLDTILPALPIIALVGALIIAMLVLWRRVRWNEPESIVQHPRSAAHAIIMWIYFVIGWLAPMGSLSAELTSIDPIPRAWSTYASDIGWSIFTAAAGAILALVMALSITRTIPMIILAWSIMLGVLPGALTGIALVSAFNRPHMDFIYSHWPIMAICYAARFGWIVFAATIWLRLGTSRDLWAQAAIDGADAWQTWKRIIVPLHAPMLAACTLTIAVLALGEAAASSLVRVPTFNPLVHVIIEKFHRLEDDMLVALSLCLVCASLLGIALVMIAGNRIVPAKKRA